MAKSAERKQAQVLRSRGRSLKEIAKILHVSPSSVSAWCQHIQLTQEQIETLQKRMRDPYYGKRAIYLQKVKDQTAEKIKQLKQKGRKEVGHLTDREFFIAGLALYWAEGFKKDKQMGFANIDPQMINFFIKWVKTYLKVGNDDIKLRITINEAYIHKVREIEAFWSQVTALPLSNFQKPTIQKVQWKKEYENKDEYKGVLRIRISKSLSNLRKILGGIEGLYLNS